MILDNFLTKEIPLNGIVIPATGSVDLGTIDLPEGYLGDRNARNANFFLTVKTLATAQPTKGAFRIGYSAKRGTTELGGLTQSIDLTNKKYVSYHVPMDLFIRPEYKDIKVYSPDKFVISGSMSGTDAEAYTIAAAVIFIGVSFDLDRSTIFPSSDNRSQY